MGVQAFVMGAMLAATLTFQEEADQVQLITATGVRRTALQELEA